MAERPLAQAIEQFYEMMPTARQLARELVGEADTAAIATELDRVCAQRLGAPIHSCLLARFGDGAGFGLELEDRRRVFVKLHNRTLSIDFLRTVASIQTQLASQGFPCPEVLHPPIELPLGIATFERFSEVGAPGDAHDPALRRAMAGKLAELVRSLRLSRLPGALTSSFVPESTWPEHPLFENRDVVDPTWMNEIAEPARRAVVANSAGQDVIGHNDWSAQHMRFEGSSIRMVFDWDSLRYTNEPMLIAGAAVTFHQNEVIPCAQCSTPEEARAFVREYEIVRGKSFNDEELEKISNYATYVIAVAARIEHYLRKSESEGGFRRALQRATGTGYISF